MRFAFTLLLFVLLLPVPGKAQENVLELGRLWETVDNGGRLVSAYTQGRFLRWPAGYPDRSGARGGVRSNSSGPLMRLFIRNYVDWYDDLTPFFEPSTPECLPPPAFRTTKYVRTRRTPTAVTDPSGTTLLPNIELTGPFIIEDPNLIADEMVQDYTFYTNGLIARSRYYSWANGLHDDYIIREVMFFNTGNVDCDPRRWEEDPVNISNLYVSYYSAVLHPNNLGDGAGSFADRGTLDGYISYFGSQPGDTLRFVYGYDGDDPDTPGDDRGDPFPQRYLNDPVFNAQGLYTEGELVSAMYAGYGLLHVDRSSSDRRDNPAQPYFSGTGNFTTTSGWRRQEMFGNLFNGGVSRHIARPDESQPPVRNNVSGWISVGPLSIPAGDSLRLVFVHAVQGISVSRAKEVGLQWARGQITDAQKNAVVATSRDSLIQTMARASWNWRGYLSQGRAIPLAPRPPLNLRVRSARQRVDLEWEASPSSNVAGYRIYRRAGSAFGEMRPIAEVPATTLRYSDEALDLGVAYYYSVVSFSDGSSTVDPFRPGVPLESSRFYNRSIYPARAFRGALSSLDSVRVVPNPYNALQESWSGERNRITFTNLTPNSTIRIFNVAGNLIKTLYHRDESAYEHWSPMLTDDNLFPSSGVYLYHITDEDTGQRVTGRFVIIR